MKRRWKSIQSRLILLLLLVLVPIVAIQAYMYYSLFQERKAAALQTNLELARGFVKTFEGFVQSVLHQEFSIGLALSLRPQVSAENQSQILLRSRADNPGVWEFFWASPSGVVLSATGPQFLGMRVDDRDYFRKIVSGQDYVISDLLLSRTTGRPSFTISRGIRDEKGALLGVIIAGILPERLDEELGIKRILGGGFALVDTKGMMVYRYPAIDQRWEERDWGKQYPQFGDALKGKEAAATVYAPFEGKNRMVGFTPVSSIGWAASAGQREEDVTGPIWAAIARSSILFGSVLLGAFLLAFLFSWKISNPIEALRNHALALGRGEERGWVPDQPIPEFKDLADTFNVMAENVRTREAALRESEERLRLAQQAARVGTFEWNLQTDRDVWTPELEALYGLRPGEFTQTGTAWAGLIHPEDRANVLKIAQQSIQTGELTTGEWRVVWPDGSVHWLAGYWQVFKDASGQPLRMTGVNLDITERKRVEEAVAEARRQVQSIIDNTPAIVYAFDLEERFLMANNALAQLLNSTPEQMIGKRRHEFMPREDADWHEENDRRVIEVGRALEFEEYSQLKGRSITWLTTKFPLRDAQGRIYAVAGISPDITERKRSEEAVLKGRARFKLLSDTTWQLLATDSPQTVVNELCREVMAHLDCQAFFNFLVDEDIGRLHLNAWAGIPEKEARKIEWLDYGVAVCGCVAREGAPISAENIFEVPDPRTELVKSYGIQAYACHPLKVGDRLIGTLSFGTKTRTSFSPDDLALMRTVTDQVATAMERIRLIKELQKSRDELENRVRARTEELERSQNRLQQLSSQLLLAQEKERKRVAMELHDGLLSELAATKYLLEGKIMLLDKGKPVDAAELRRVADILGGAIKEARRLMNNLHPSILDELGLISTLGWLCGEYQKSYPNISVQKEIAVSEKDISVSLKVVIYRVLQEALNNFARHGNGDRVGIFLSKSNSTLELTIQDNGRGFDMGKVQKGVGLESMRERVEISGGEFQIESGIGQGTTIQATWTI